MADQVYGNVDQRQSFSLDNDAVYANPEKNETHDEKKNKGEKSTGGDSTVKCYRVAVVSLGLLCVLLLAIIISVVIKGTAERKQLQHEMQLQKFSYNNLTEEQDHVQATLTMLTQDKDQLEGRNRALAQQITKLFNSICKWKCFGSSRYYISSDERNWTDSQQQCMDQGAHLVIIESKEEQDFIISQGKRAWIGLSDLETEGVWKWVDGTDLDNTRYWMEGEPNGGVYEGGTGDCAEVRIAERSEESGWNDSVCEMKKHYICEKQTS